MSNPKIITNATFANEEGKTLSYKDLKENQKVKVAGILDETKVLVNFLCTVKGKTLVAGSDIYSFVPAEASSLENSMDMNILYFQVEDEESILVCRSNFEIAIKRAKEKLEDGKTVKAFGRIKSHYRLDTHRVLTSYIKDIFTKDDNTYICTRNSVYRIF